MYLPTFVGATLALVRGADAAFGLTSTSTRFKVDTDAGLVFEVNRFAGSVISHSRIC